MISQVRQGRQARQEASGLLAMTTVMKPARAPGKVIKTSFGFDPVHKVFGQLDQLMACHGRMATIPDRCEPVPGQE